MNRAEELNLEQSVEWRNLGHYKKHLVSSAFESLADDPKFFLSPDGKHNPKAELEETLRAFFRPEVGDLNPQCVFPARYAWLKSVLHFDSALLPEQACPRLTEWQKALNAHGLTLVYPAAYLNNPASMFGHTMLRIDAGDQTDKTRLLAYGVTYAADTGDDDFFFFAIRGLTGLYPGRFGILPYYAQVRMYSDLESRDIWEYPLALTPAEIRMLLLHLWELAPTYFDYYFFDENCSYHLLSLFEVARPSLHLTDEYYFKTIPIDTLRQTIEQVGLSAKPTYRPSSATILRERSKLLSREERRVARELAESDATEATEFKALPEERRARVLEVASELLNYQTFGQGNDDEAIQKRMFSLLLARSKLSTDAPAELPVPPIRPDEGHRTGKIGFGVGLTDNEWVTELQLRPAYHDILDPLGGFVPGAQLDFLDLRLHYREGDHLSVDRFALLDILSVSPRNEFMQPISWRIHLGVDRQHVTETADSPYFSLDGGGGVAYEPVSRLRLYAMPEVASQFAEYYDGRASVGIGGSGGILFDVGESYALHLEARSLRFPFTDEHSAVQVKLEQRYAISQQQDLRFAISRSGEFGNYYWEAMLSWEHFL